MRGAQLLGSPRVKGGGLEREGVMTEEDAFTTAREMIDIYRLPDDRLEIVTISGEVLTFARVG